MKKLWAGGFLYNPKTNKVFLHKRDNNTIYNPNALAFFGGLRNEGETPEQCFQRELFEEIGLKVKPSEIIPLDHYLNKEFDTYRYSFYVISDIGKDKLTLGEGAGFDWFKLDEVFEKEITRKTALDLKTFLVKKQK